MLVTAYCPLAQGRAAGDPRIAEIARRYGKRAEQVTLRWLVEQQQVAAIPRSGNPDHIRSNFDIWDFALDSEDQREIASLARNLRLVNPDFAPVWDR